MAVMNLDDAEREDRLSLSTPPEALDVRRIASTGASIVVYLKILAIGPVGIGALAVASTASAPWEHLPLIIRSTAAYSQGMSVPDVLLLKAAAPSETPLKLEARRDSLGGEALPALEVTDFEPDVTLSQTKLMLPQVTLDGPTVPVPRPGVPNPPTIVVFE